MTMFPECPKKTTFLTTMPDSPLKALLDQVELAIYVYYLVNWLFSIVGYLLHFYCRKTYMNYKNVKHF